MSDKQIEQIAANCDWLKRYCSQDSDTLSSYCKANNGNYTCFGNNLPCAWTKTSNKGEYRGPYDENVYKPAWPACQFSGQFPYVFQDGKCKNVANMKSYTSIFSSPNPPLIYDSKENCKAAHNLS